jgi:hypothetical protein
MLGGKKEKERESGLFENITVHDVNQTIVQSSVPQLVTKTPPAESMIAELNSLIKEVTPKQVLHQPSILMYLDKYAPYYRFAQLVSARLLAKHNKVMEIAKEIESMEDTEKAIALFRKAWVMNRDGSRYIIRVTAMDVEAMITWASTFPLNALSHALTYGKLPITSKKPELPAKPSEEETGK